VINKAISGKEILIENLREKCIYNFTYFYNTTRPMFWDYMRFVHRACYNTINEECFSIATNYLKIPVGEIYRCLRESFSSSNWDDYKTVNTLLEDDLVYMRKFGTGLYPSVVINNKTFRGNIDTLGVYNAICAGFLDPPTICR